MDTQLQDEIRLKIVIFIQLQRKRRLEILDREPIISISNINLRYKKNG